MNCTFKKIVWYKREKIINIIFHFYKKYGYVRLNLQNLTLIKLNQHCKDRKSVRLDFVPEKMSSRNLKSTWVTNRVSFFY